MGFPHPKLAQICKSAMSNSAIRWKFLSQNNPKNLDPSVKGV